ncbi:Membrane-bound lytic murein transglycosylase F [Candidatus Hepatincola sp. Av]
MLDWVFFLLTLLLLVVLVTLIFKNKRFLHDITKYTVISLVFTVIIFMLLIFSVVSPSSHQKVKVDPNTVIVGYAEKPPFVFMNNKGQLAGLEVDLVNKSLENQGFKVVWREYPKKDLPTLLQKGRISLAVAGFTSHLPLPNNILLSVPYLTDEVVFFSNAKYFKQLNDETKDADLLTVLTNKNYLVGVVYDDEVNNLAEYLKNWRLQIQSLDFFEFVTESINANYVMVGVTNKTTLNFYKKLNKLDVQTFKIRESFPLDFVILSNKTKLITIINNYIKANQLVNPLIDAK